MELKKAGAVGAANRDAHGAFELRQKCLRHLGVGVIRSRFDVGNIGRPMADVRGHSDDRIPLASGNLRLEPLAERVFLGPIKFGQAFTHNRDPRGRSRVVIVELASALERNLQAAEIFRADGAKTRDDWNLRRRRGRAFDGNRHRRIGAAHGQISRQHRGLNPRQRSHPLQDLLVEKRNALTLVLRRRSNAEGQLVGGIESRLDTLRVPQTLERQSGADQQNRGQGSFGDHQHHAVISRNLRCCRAILPSAPR